MLYSSAVAKEYDVAFDHAHINPNKLSDIDKHVQIITRHKDHYKAAEKLTNVPWWFIGIIHGLECGYRFDCHLANGDPLGRPTRHVPRGLLAHTFEESVVQAFKQVGLLGQKDWQLPHCLFFWEKYNGFGYRAKKVPTPYLWSYTNLYKSGKFIKDGKFSRSAVSGQAGAVAVFLGLVKSGVIQVSNDNVTDVNQTPVPVEVAATVATPTPTPAPVQPTPIVQTAGTIDDFDIDGHFKTDVTQPSLAVPVDPDKELQNDTLIWLGALISFLAYHHYITGVQVDLAHFIIQTLSGLIVSFIGRWKTHTNVKSSQGS
jgi:lysozyme family protein